MWVDEDWREVMGAEGKGGFWLCRPGGGGGKEGWGKKTGRERKAQGKGRGRGSERNGAEWD